MLRFTLTSISNCCIWDCRTWSMSKFNQA